MKDINQVTIRGRVGSVNIFGKDSNVLSLSVATTESYKDRTGRWNDITTWHRVKAFSGRSGIPPFSALRKGMVVQVEGKLSTNKFVGKDGNEREMTEIEANEITCVVELKEDDLPAGNHAHNYEDNF